MNELELLECMHMRTLTDGSGKKHLLSVPITQYVTAEQKEQLSGEKKVAIKCSKISDDVLAVIEEPVFFDNRKEEISARVFGTQSDQHPKTERIMAQPDHLISGASMRFVKRVQFNDGIDQYRLTPAEINAEA